MGNVHKLSGVCGRCVSADKSAERGGGRKAAAEIQIKLYGKDGENMGAEALTLEKFEEASEIVTRVTSETKLVYDKESDAVVLLDYQDEDIPMGRISRDALFVNVDSGSSEGHPAAHGTL